MRTIDTQAYLSTLKEVVNEGNDVSLIISGGSMSPFLVHHRDAILIGKPTEPLKRGDMVFYQRATGQYVMHRIRWVRPEGLYIIGDAQTVTEGPVNPKWVFAIVKKVQRKGKWIGPEDRWWRFFATVWLWVVPLRRVILWGVGKIKN